MNPSFSEGRWDEILEHPNSYWRRKMHWGTAGIYIFYNSKKLLESEGLLEMF
jgi:hypothetical protein